MFLNLSHTLHFTGPFVLRVISPPPFAQVLFTLIWIFSRCILYSLFHFAREPLSSTGELGEIQILLEEMLVASKAFRKILAPTRTIHMNTKTKGLHINPETFVQARKIPCQTRLLPKIVNYSECISNDGREEGRDSTGSADGVLQSVGRSVGQ